MKRYKRIISLLFTILCISAFVSFNYFKSPTEVVETNLSGLQKGKENEFLDKAIKDIIETRYSVIHDETRECIYDLYKNLEYEIIKEEIFKEDNEATVYVEATLPDVTRSVGESLMNSIFEMQSNPMSENPTDEEIRDRMNTYIRNGFESANKEKRKIKIYLTKKYGKWVLDEDKESLKRFIGTVDWTS